MFSENTRTALTGRDLRIIKKDLKGINTAGAITAGDVFCSYGETVGGGLDAALGGILLDAAVRENGNTGFIRSLVLREWLSSSGTLQKPALDIYIFRELTVPQTSGDAFAPAGDNVNIEQIISIDEGDWIDIDANNAIVFLKPDVDVEGSDTTLILKAVIVMKSSTKTFASVNKLRIEFGIVRD
jgi:hypothetical protein